MLNFGDMMFLCLTIHFCVPAQQQVMNGGIYQVELHHTTKTVKNHPE